VGNQFAVRLEIHFWKEGFQVANGEQRDILKVDD